MKIKELRESCNVKQEQIAELLKMSPANYCKKESGQIKWSLSEAKKISDFFGKTIEELFFAEEVSKNDTAMLCCKIEDLFEQKENTAPAV